MGENGAKQSAAGAAMAERLVDELATIGDVSSKKMFGGYGIFDDGVMFALVDASGNPFLRADDTTSSAFEAAGSEAHGRMPYWRIPAEVMNDEERLRDWAGRARDMARAAKKR